MTEDLTQRGELYRVETVGGRMVDTYRALDKLAHLGYNFGGGKVCVIGIGGDAGYIGDPWYEQPYEPYVLAGWMNSLGGEGWRLAAVEPVERLLSHLSESEWVYLDERALDKEMTVRGTWERLGRDLGGVIEVGVKENDGSLVTLDPYDSMTSVEYLVGEGMQRIRVPEWFKGKLEVGEIELLNNDVRDVVGLEADLLVCQNVLMWYSQPVQEEIFMRLSEMGKEVMIISEGIPDPQSPVTLVRQPTFGESGGWLDEETMGKKYGMNIIDRFSRQGGVQYILGRK